MGTTTMIRRRGVLVALVGAVVLLVAACTTQLTEGNGHSYSPSVSASGRYAAFSSYATDLVSGDDNGKGDIFLWDRTTDAVTPITEGNADSGFPEMSDDGRSVLFSSRASDLVPGDSGSSLDLFVWDRISGATTRVTAGTTIDYLAAISADGRYVAYSSTDSPVVPGDTNGLTDILVWDRTTGASTRITDGQAYQEFPGDDYEWSASWMPSISADGGRVAFTSEAINLIPGDATVGRNVFVWDRASGTTTRVTGFADGFSVHPDISADGQHVAFWSNEPLTSGDGALTGDIFVWDRATAAVTRLTSSDASPDLDPTISADGGSVAYVRNLGLLALWDRATGSNVVIATGRGQAHDPDIAGSGDVVVFSSDPANWAEQHTDIYDWVRPPT